MDRKVLTDGYSVFRDWMLEHTGLYVDNFITIQSMASTFMLNEWLLSKCTSNKWRITTIYY